MPALDHSVRAAARMRRTAFAPAPDPEAARIRAGFVVTNLYTSMPPIIDPTKSPTSKRPRKRFASAGPVAAALMLYEERTAGAEFVTLDTALKDAAAREGFSAALKRVLHLVRCALHRISDYRSSFFFTNALPDQED